MSHIWLLTHLPNSKSSQMMLDAAVRRGHRVELLNPLEAGLVISEPDDRLAILGKKGARTLPDIVMTRLGSSSPLAGLHAIRELEHRGVPVCNGSYGLERSRDKVRCFQELRLAGIPVPKTIAIGSEVEIETVVQYISGPPWILKLPISTQGNGVMYVDSATSLRSIVDAIHSLNGSLLLQEFISESSGIDFRVLVVDGVARAAMRRQAKAGEFRSNLHRGGKPQGIELTEGLVKLAESAAKVLRLDLAGVDLLEVQGGYQIIEVNGSPGLEGLQSVTSHSLSDCIIEMIEKRSKKA